MSPCLLEGQKLVCCQKDQPCCGKLASDLPAGIQHAMYPAKQEKLNIRMGWSHTLLLSTLKIQWEWGETPKAQQHMVRQGTSPQECITEGETEGSLPAYAVDTSLNSNMPRAFPPLWVLQHTRMAPQGLW